MKWRMHAQASHHDLIYSILEKLGHAIAAGVHGGDNVLPIEDETDRNYPPVRKAGGTQITGQHC